MANTVKISVRQFTIIVILFTIGTTILIIPGELAADAKQDAWIASIIGVAFNLLLVFLYTALGKRFPGMTIIQYNEQIYGKWLGGLVSLSFVFFCFIGAATVLFYMGNFIVTQIMPATPIQAINILFCVIVAMGLRLGLETLARTAEILFPWVLLLFFVLFVSVLPEFEIQKLQPIFEANLKSLIKAAVAMSGTSALPYIVLLMIFPAHIHNLRKTKRGFLAGSILGGGFMFLITLMTIGVLGASITERQMYPSFSLAKRINVGGFFSRVEILIAAIWFMTVFFKTVFYFYGCVQGLAQMLKIPDYRPLVLPLSMILVVYSQIVYPNVVYSSTFDTTVWIPYILFFGCVIPIVTLIVGFIRSRSRGEQM